MTEVSQPTVFVVDDDEAARKSVCALVNSMGVNAQAYASAEEFLDAYTPDRRGCLVTDVRMPEMSGIELQQQLLERGMELPVIMITAFARTENTVKAMQQGALTLLDKPPPEDALWEAIRKALALDASRHGEQQWREEIQERFAQLTPSEVDVMREIIAGKPNKQIASHLDMGLRTVEARRHNIFQKMQVRSVAELVRLAIEADLNL